MRRRARALAPVLLLGLALAGCVTLTAGDPVEVGTSTAPAARHAIEGLVLAPDLVPIPGARVSLVPGNLTAPVAADGKYRLDGLAPGTYLLEASAPGHHAATRQVAVVDATLIVNFSLEAVPPGLPRWETQELTGYVTCAAMVTLGGHGSGTEHGASCGAENPNDRRDLSFEIPLRPGLSALVVEVVWEAGNVGARHFSVTLSTEHNGTEEEIGGLAGESPLKHVVGAGVTAKHFAGGGILRAEVSPEGSLTDDESPTDAGLVYDQPYTIYLTLFENGPPPAGFSALARTTSH